MQFIVEVADICNMTVLSFIRVCLQVLKNPRIIIIALVTIFFIFLGNYVVNYRKRPRKARKRRAKAEKTPAAAEEHAEDEGVREDTAAAKAEPPKK